MADPRSCPPVNAALGPQWPGCHDREWRVVPWVCWRSVGRAGASVHGRWRWGLAGASRTERETMANRGHIDARAMMVDLLLQKVAEDLYLSNTIMDFLEELMLPHDVPAYAAVLMEKMRDETYPSVSMMRRLVGLL